MSKRLLLVEQSATMRYVLEKHSESLGFVVDACETYSAAFHHLNEQYRNFGAEYTALLFGWPTTPQDDAAEFAQHLESNDYKDLPVVVMSTDMRAETRAWVAGRDNTAVLPWKEYQGLEALLQRLIDVAPDDSGDAFAAKFDNSDVHLLIVDDSATIRYSLRDLFQMQGYRVTLAATQEEAMSYAIETAFDIAILDFYLTETTGDVLCRELMANEMTGDIVCTVLTGTYSDHIIKRSLRAGAVECMFKNESSELLLSRIDAISRFVRQQRILQSEQYLLEEIIDSVAGAVLLMNTAGQIVYVNDTAIEELQLESKQEIIGQFGENVLELDGPATPGAEVHAASWRMPDGTNCDVDYQHAIMQPSGYSLIRFVRRSVAIDLANVELMKPDSSSQEVAAVLMQQLSLNADAESFLIQLQEYLSTVDSLPFKVSLFIMDVCVLTPVDEQGSLADEPWLATLVRESLESIYRKPGHVALLTDKQRFGFLFRHKEEAQAYLMVRKIMQMCLELTENSGEREQGALAEGTSSDVSGRDSSEPRLACTGSLLSLTKNASQPAGAVLQHAFKSMKLVNSRGINQALLLDVRRMLSVYPK